VVRGARPPEPPSAFEHSLLINSPPIHVLAAFFDPHALSVWWRAARSVTTPRPLGVYAVEWEPGPERDEVLGRLGGVFHGTVMEYLAGSELLLADAWWIPPDTDPLGPMSLTVSCTTMDGPGCRLRVRQSGFDDGARWRRYYAVISRGWVTSLGRLKDYLENLRV
jgi:uncharacterized protein YndB with AHSA1/START domain